MSSNKLAAMAALLLAAASATAAAADANPTGCALQAHRVTAVAPYRVGAHIGKAVVNRLRGATIYVEAERHMSAEWLEKELRGHIAAMRGSAEMADCPFDIEGLQVQVRPRGPGYLVTLVAKDSAGAQEVLRRARLLLD